MNCPSGNYWCVVGDPCSRCTAEARRVADAAKAASQRDWFARTGHCGQCGQPAGYCVCTDTQPCACRDLHRMGDGLDPDALARFADAPAVDQGELFA